LTSDLARWLFDPSGLTPHGFCLLWEPWLIWTHAASNVAIGLAYFSIPVVLIRFVRRRRDLVFKPVFGLFAAFILLCGAGHWADLLTLWYPLYGVEGVIKAATAAVSLLTAAALWPLLPRALALPSPAQMREANAALRQAQKMEAVGRLTGGVAHDFNNVLQAVTGNLELIRRRVRDERPDVARLAGNALDAAAKAAGLTSQLLAFARRQKLDPKPLDPVEVVEGMRGLMARTAGGRIALRVEAEEGAGFCLADRNQLESALLNLAINARDAIGAGAGAITVSVRAERVEGAAEGGWPPEGDYVRIAVRDDGPGMPEEVRRRAFEPFFTTKAPGKGTGLGLAQIHGFAHQSGGTVRIDSAPGKGTEVAILLPRAAHGAAPGAELGDAAGPEAEPTESGEVVLVVEDDALVRAAMAETLRELRYRVVEAADADAALALLDGGAGVDAILSDVTMPGSMDGVGFAAAARARRPGIPLLLATGHVGALDGRALPPRVGVLRKPLGRTAIAVALRRALATTEEPEPVGA
jgi:signal transduction histidine kinase